MLALRRRHLKSCPHRSGAYLKCRCPLWAVGSLDGVFVRKSLDTGNLEKAELLRRQIEFDKKVIERVSVQLAGERWIADCEARQLKPPSIRKYTEVKRELTARWGNIPVRSVSVDDVRKLRESWTYSGTTTGKRLELIRAFFSFCVSSGWIEKNPAKGVPEWASLGNLRDVHDLCRRWGLGSPESQLIHELIMAIIYLTQETNCATLES